MSRLHLRLIFGVFELSYYYNFPDLIPGLGITAALTITLLPQVRINFAFNLVHALT